MSDFSIVASLRYKQGTSGTKLWEEFDWMIKSVTYHNDTCNDTIG